MDLLPFDDIVPCGLEGMKMVNMADFYKDKIDYDQLVYDFIQIISHEFGFDGYNYDR